MLKSRIRTPTLHHDNRETFPFLTGTGKIIYMLSNDIFQADENGSLVNIDISFQLVSFSKL